jgi:aminomethyltransferase
MGELHTTPLHQMHQDLGAKMVPFAGYDMPVQYPMGVLKEHLHCREHAGLFDVSHMGQVILRPLSGSYEDLCLAIESLIPVSVLGLKENRQRYGFFTNDAGGIRDDLMFANRGDHIFMVVNAGCKNEDIAHMRAELSDRVDIQVIEDRALLALQGPASEAALASLDPAAADMRFMDVATLTLVGAECWVSRSGYSGEDGYEISVPAGKAVDLAQALLAVDGVEPIGLGARDSLRLEAGLCLYGNDIDTETSPIEAGLIWAIQKPRRSGGERAGGFPGADRILRELDEGAARKRVGLKPLGRAPMRPPTALFADDQGATPVGAISSGGFGPSVGGPVAMGYVDAAHAAIGSTLFGEVRGKYLPVEVVKLPFIAANFKR